MRRRRRRPPGGLVRLLALALAAAPACSHMHALGSSGSWFGASFADEGASSSVPLRKRVPYAPDRRDYFAFRAAHPEILEPNYLPYMVHRGDAVDARGDPLFLCRWPDAAMPLAVRIEAPAIPASLQSDLYEIDPAIYVQAVDRALRTWEEALEGLVSFVRVGAQGGARLRLRLLGERAPRPNPETIVLGATEALIGACRVRGIDPDAADRVHVDFEVPELVVYVADEHGLLTERQVERIALHEIGHALGMLGHSPISGDLMFAAYRDTAGPARLETEDVHSFVSLYRLPNGTLYAHATGSTALPAPSPAPPPGEARLALAPFVEATLGFELRFPHGWMHVDGPRGVFAANGPVWSFDASIEVLVSRQPTLEEFLQRNGRALFGAAWLRRRVETQLAGVPGLRVEFEDADGETAVRVWLLERGGEKREVVMVLARVPAAQAADWGPWIDASIATLRFR